MTAPPTLVLTAGLGTRLWPLTLTRAKAAAPVAGVPLVERILRHLAGQGVRHAVLNLHHRPETITRLIGDGSHLGVQVRYSWEPDLLGSAGGPRHALSLMGAGRWLIVNGDTLCDVSLEELLSHHQTMAARVTLAVIPQERPGRYGGVVVDDDHVVRAFTSRSDPRPAWHFVGIQVADSSVFAPLQDGQPADSVAGRYRELMIEDPGAVRAWRTAGHFVDIGTPRDYLEANLAIAAAEGRHTPLVGERCHVSASARLVDSVLWDDVEVGAGVSLERCVVVDGARIPPDRHYVDVALAPAPATVEPRSGVRIEDGLVVCSLDR